VEKAMMVLVTYDVNTASAGGARRLRRVARICQNYGQRVQNSVFECLVDPEQWAQIQHELFKIYEPDKDSLRFYFLGANWKHRVEHHGAKATYDPEGTIII
jgi:CRISPR-associated protein Cas2